MSLKATKKSKKIQKEKKVKSKDYNNHHVVYYSAKARKKYRKKIFQESSEPFCSFCFESNMSSSLISPCLCSGSQAYIHAECLNEWRKTEYNTQKQKCFLCNFPY